ncbi:MAG: hypothetical protein HQL68_08320 [Magnetococcales bacterium]|nr:hypothetical protein [Magnetococcales bacterium]
MLHRSTFLICMLFLNIIISSSALAVDTSNENYRFENIKLANGGGASYFKGDSEKAAIFSPGSRYGKESFYFLGDRLQKLNIGSVSTGGSSSDIHAAITFLKGKGYSKIALVGGSMGGEAVLGVLQEGIDESVFKVIVLAPFGGNPIKSDTIDKLFIVAQKDGIVSSSDIVSLFERSSEPKTIKIYEKSRAHAQELFASKRTKNDVTDLIVKFINSQ